MASRNLLRAIIMGPPGSGKGTISSWIVRDFQMSHLSSGDMLRAQMGKGTGAGVAAKEAISRGELVADDVMNEMILAELEEITGKSFLLDGYPRTVHQAEALSKAQPVDVVVNLAVPFKTIRERIENRWVHQGSGRVYHTVFNPPKNPGVDDETGEPLIQREDDKPHSVSARLDIYQKQTEPLLEFYRKEGKLAEFAGTESKVIYPEVKSHLAALFSTVA
ncbi:GTP:AMP phosphotransferase AK3, mitochondrial-like [Sycon ciliatum]|uniref:GTP:AMP phosphotransferase AK3, mitochondrial-like n=1 Tax=Sycon ciliatum TaxID=27933 RepID=UPI0031F717A1